MARIKGKTPTRAQRNALLMNGINDPENWLYVKTEHQSDDGSKNVARNSSKNIYMVFVNKNTGETERIGGLTEEMYG